MATIRIQERTSVEDVIAWRTATCDIFYMTRASGFEAGVHGLALAALASCTPATTSLTLICEFDEPRTTDELQDTLIGSAFGFALIRLVKKIQFSKGTPASDNFKQLLGELFKSGSGEFGTGKSRYLICPDPIYPVPLALMEQGGAMNRDYFPSPSLFSYRLTQMVKAMGFKHLLSSTGESSIVSFVYETLMNSWEHGLPAEKNRRARSTRALIVEKLVIQSKEIDSRYLSHQLKHYLKRIAENDISLGVICFTIADQGEGIQTTLPPVAGETSPHRFARAFERGESRKARGLVARGLGLPNVVTAAHNLQALVRITSGNLLLEQDFSLGENKYPVLNFEATKEIPNGFQCGTCLSIFLPEYGVNLDQGNLFPQ